MNETDNQIRLRRAKEALETARKEEAAARKALYEAEQYTKRAKLRYEELFETEEKAECHRRKSS